jgi:hypothetical protein
MVANIFVDYKVIKVINKSYSENTTRNMSPQKNVKKGTMQDMKV